MILQQTREYVDYITRIQLPIVASNWAEEIFSDLIGTGLFGPAFISSLSLLLLPSQDLDSADEAYPTSRFRVQTCINALDRTDPGFGYKELNRKSTTNLDYDHLIKPWREVVGSQIRWPIDTMYKTVFNSILRMKHNLVNEAKELLRDNKYSYSDFASEVPKLRTRLLAWLPPNEYQTTVGGDFKVAKIQAIFNAAWLAYLDDIKTLTAMFPQFPDIKVHSKFCDLVTKGIDLSDIQVRWRSIENGED